MAPRPPHPGLYLAGLAGTELLHPRVTGSGAGGETGPAWTVEKLEAPPSAAAFAISPVGGRNLLLFVLT